MSERQRQAPSVEVFHSNGTVLVKIGNEKRYLSPEVAEKLGHTLWGVAAKARVGRAKARQPHPDRNLVPERPPEVRRVRPQPRPLPDSEGGL